MMIFRSFLLQLTSKPVTVSYHYGNRLMVLIIRTLLRECVKFLPSDVSATLYVCRLTRRLLFMFVQGGLKAVLWTDALQNVFSLLAVVFIIILGVYQLGGSNKIYNVAKEEGRVELFKSVTLSLYPALKQH